MTNAKGKCFKCLGSGRIGAFGHYAAGVCFQCNGSGELDVGQSKSGKAHVPTPESAREFLRTAYRAAKAFDAEYFGCSWTEAAAAPFDGQSDFSTLVMVRNALGRLESDEQTKVRGAFAAIGANLGE